MLQAELLHATQLRLLTVETRSLHIFCAFPTEHAASSLNLTLVSPLRRATCYHGEPEFSLPLSFNS